MSTDKPPHQNPALPEFWNHRFRGNVTPWDSGRVPADLESFARTFGAEQSTGVRILIPGCGSGYEARHLAERGWQVKAIDFSAAAIDVARATLGSHAGCLMQADFFAFDAGPPFDVIYERAFLCALPRRLWPDYARRVAHLLLPDGLLAGYFYFSDEPKGPPFGTAPGELQVLLSRWFALEEDKPVADSIPVFAGKERWQIWRRTRQPPD
jgi:thiopurine S-methyltransferase